MYKLKRIFTEDIQAEMHTWVGKELKKYKCDPFTFGNQVYQIAGLFIGDNSYKLTNCIEVVDYFGADEDICFLNLCRCKEEEIVSGLKDEKQIEIYIHRKINRIELLKEHQYLKDLNGKEFSYDFIRGFSIILEDNYELAFEKIDPFSEEIAITRGESLIDKFQEIDRSEDFDSGCQFICERDKVIIL